MSWPQLVFTAANWLWFLLGAAALAAAFAAALRKDFLERKALLGRRGELLILGLFLPLFVVLVRLAQHGNFQLTGDSAHVVNSGWNLVHGHGYYSSLYGQPFTGIHCMFTTALLSPLLLAWERIEAYLVVHALALASTVYGVYSLARRRTDSRALPWLLALMTLAHPRFLNLMITIVEDSSFAAPLFVWAAYLFESGRPAAAAASLLLLLTTKEEAAVVLFGVGAYFLARKDRRPAAGLALMAASVTLALLEIHWMQESRKGLECPQGFVIVFPQLGATVPEILQNALRRPWIFALALVHPARNLVAGLENLFYAGGFAVLAGAAAWPAYIAWIPHQLGVIHPNYHTLFGYYGGFVFGPLLWATVIGATAAWRRVTAPRRRFLAAYMLVVSALGFFRVAGFHNPRLMPSTWREGVPKAAALIPADAPLWCDSYLTPHFALRRHLKALPLELPDCQFQVDLFLPDYVLLSTYWPRLAKGDAVERITGFLKRRGYEEALRHHDLLLLRRPGAAGPGGATPLRVGVDL